MAKLSVLKLPRAKYLDSMSIPPLFLAPALQSICISSPHPQSPTHTHPFSTTPAPQIRLRNREKNKSRGVSAIRRTGPRVPLSVSKYPLPEPVWDPPLRKEFKTREDHGLWGFFNEERTAMSPPEDLHAHGRAWTYVELANKGWHDLWKIWWMCLRERNWLRTEASERKRVEAGYGDWEGEQREKVVKETMRNIRKVLLRRSDAFEEAIKLTGQPEFWKEHLRKEEGRRQFQLQKDRAMMQQDVAAKTEDDDIVERMETGRPMVDDPRTGEVLPPEQQQQQRKQAE